MPVCQCLCTFDRPVCNNNVVHVTVTTVSSNQFNCFTGANQQDCLICQLGKYPAGKVDSCIGHGYSVGTNESFGTDLFCNGKCMLEKAIEDVAQIRMELGSFQKHTIERTMNNLGVAVENITEGQSVIEDADMAEKVSDMASGQILAASSRAMIAQANQKPQSVISLLHSS